MESGLLLDVVVGEGSAVLELLTSEDESLLVGRDALLVLDLGLDVVNGVRGLDLEGDGLSSEGLHENLHSTAETEDEMESGLLLDVVVGEGSTVFELLASEDESLLVGRDALLVLDLSLDVVDSIRWLDLESDGLAGESFDENLHFALLVCLLILIKLALLISDFRTTRSELAGELFCPIIILAASRNFQTPT